jgi:ribose transport system permease protein
MRLRAGAQKPALRNWVPRLHRQGIFFALLGLVAIFAISSPRFATWPNISVVLLQGSLVGIMAVPGAMLILMGKVDLAVGSVMVLTSVVFGTLYYDGVPLAACIVLSLGVGVAWGVFAGFLVGYVGLSPIVVTLGGLAGVRGLAEMLSNARTNYGFGSNFGWLGTGSIAGLDVPVWIVIATFVAGFLIWYAMPYGRRMTALGADPEAAHAVGIKTRALPFVVYIGSGLAAAVAGLILTSQLDSSPLSIGLGMELRVITAIMLGGVAFTGGRGSLWGVLFGVAFIAALDNGLVLMNVNQFLSDVVIGVALIGAAAMDRLNENLERVMIPDVQEEGSERRASASGVDVGEDAAVISNVRK